MCCFTHEERDKRDFAKDRDALIKLIATEPQLRCQCEFGQPCLRAMTQEDFMCDWCRAAGDSIERGVIGGHNKECEDLSRSPDYLTREIVTRDFHRTMRVLTGLAPESSVKQALDRETPQMRDRIISGIEIPPWLH